MSADPIAEKTAAARAALDYIQPGMKVGLGTGSTAEILVRLLHDRLRQGLSLQAVVATSQRTEALARRLGFPVTDLDQTSALDVCVDGADEVDPHFHLVKGGGGAHLREKIVASASQTRIIMVDSSKPVVTLGAFGLAVEIIPFARAVVKRMIERLGGTPTLRRRADNPFVTDEGNWIFDCDFGRIEDPVRLAAELSAVAGVVEHGLFCHMTEIVLIGRGDEVEVRSRDAT